MKLAAVVLVLVVVLCLVLTEQIARGLGIERAVGLLSLANLATLVIGIKLGWRQALLGVGSLAVLTQQPLVVPVQAGELVLFDDHALLQLPHFHLHLLQLRFMAALFLLALKGFAAWHTGSVAMLGSLADTALDLLASLVTLYGVKLAAEPADHDHRFGHGKAEALAALFQVALITASAAAIGTGVTACDVAVMPMPMPMPVTGTTTT